MLTLQNLRAVTPGVAPTSLASGQLCFNIPDRLMFVGDGSDFKTPFNGTPVAGVAGQGWFSLPIGFPQLSEYFIDNPSVFGDIPNNNQVLTWDSTLNRVVWADGGGEPGPGEGGAYLTTNAAVAAAPGSDTSAKISNALGITPSEGYSVIVSGVSGDTYQAFYQYLSGFWVFAASYAPPMASEVPVSAIPGLSATTVQNALAEIFGIASDAQTESATAIATANSAQLAANTAELTAGLAQADAADAQTSANAAQTTANTALVTSNTALSVANGSQTAADNAQVTANTAQNSANAAQLTASSAAAAAAAAQLSADNAQTDADLARDESAAALSIANAAQADANAAQISADNAQNTANSAVLVANQAQGAADAAQTTASNALSIANNALPKSGGTMTGDIQFTNGQPVDAGSF